MIMPTFVYFYAHIIMYSGKYAQATLNKHKKALCRLFCRSFFISYLKIAQKELS